MVRAVQGKPQPPTSEPSCEPEAEILPEAETSEQKLKKKVFSSNFPQKWLRNLIFPYDSKFQKIRFRLKADTIISNTKKLEDLTASPEADVAFPRPPTASWPLHDPRISASSKASETVKALLFPDPDHSSPEDSDSTPTSGLPPVDLSNPLALPMKNAADKNKDSKKGRMRRLDSS